MNSDTQHQAIRDKLEMLYGAEVAAMTYAKLESLLHPIHPAADEGLAVSEKDVLLIAYGDHIRDGRRHPLEVLHKFLKESIHPIINGVHILPFYPYSSDDGFSVIDYYAVDEALGDWDDVSAMSADFRLMFDAVFNHISAQSEWFQRFKRGVTPYTDYFVAVPPQTDLSAVVRPRALPLLTAVETNEGIKHVWTTFSDDQIDLNVQNPDVLLELIKVLRFYVQHGAQLIRLDAIAFLWKEIGTSSIHLEQTHLIVQLMRDVLNIVAPSTIIITETNVPHQENISYFGDGTNEAQLVYQFPLPPLVLHTLTTGDATHLSNWAAGLDAPGSETTFFNFTASHDGIGMRPATGILSQAEINALVELASAHGGNVSYKTNSDGSQSPYELNVTYFDAITHPDITAQEPQTAVARFMVSQAIALALAGVPGIYLHSLYGSRNWHEGVRQTGRFRTINREKLDLKALQAALAAETSIRHQVFSAYRRLLEARTNCAALHPLGEQRVLSLSAQVFALERIAPDGSQRVLALHNVTGQVLTLDVPDSAGAWTELLTGDAWDGGIIGLQPYQIAWLRSDD